MKLLKFIMISLFAFLIFTACGKKKEEVKVLHIPALSSEVKIYEDPYGIYHIYGKNDADVSFAQGFLQAKTRLFFMEFLRRLGKGELTSLFGEVIPEVKMLDAFIKAVQFDLHGRMVYEVLAENLSPEMQFLSRKFCEGINYYIRGIKEGKYPLPPGFKYYDIPADAIQEWDPTDIAAIGRIFEFFLSGMLSLSELDINIWENNLPPELIGDWIRFKPATPTTTMYGDVVTSANIPYKPEEYTNASIKNVTKQLRVLIDTVKKFILGSYRYGSNNWIISGKITKDGKTLLANDPHLPLLTPPIWEIFHLSSNDENAIGFSVPGLPGLLIGVTDHIAWGETVAGYDVADYYFEKISCNNSGCYAEKGTRSVKVELYMAPHYTRTGAHTWEESTIPLYYLPGEEVLIVWDEKGIKLPYPTPATHYAIGFRWTGQEITNEFDAFLGYLKAEDTDDFVEAVKHFMVGAQNQVAIDREGNIVYYPHALIPVRSPGSHPWKIMKGYLDEGRWIGFLKEDQIPFLKNPERGFVNTSNNDILGVLQNNDPATEHPYYYSALDLGFRAKRVEDLILEGKKENKLDLEYMKMIQRDVKSLLAERCVKFILQAAENRPDLVSQWNLYKAIEHLRNWKSYNLYSGIDHGTLKYTDEQKKESISAAIFSIWWREMVTLTLGDEVEYYHVPFPDADLPARQTLIILHILEDPSETITSYDPAYGDSKLFDDVRTPERETRDYIILKALKLALEAGEKSFGTPQLNEWRWGNIHQLFMINPFIAASRGLYPTDGGEYTVNLASTIAGFLNQPIFVQVAGPSMRMVVSMDENGVHAEASLPGANNGDFRNGPDLFPYWWEYRYFPLELKKTGEQRLVLVLER